MKGIFFSQIKINERSQGAVLKVFDEIKAFEGMGCEMRHVNVAPVAVGLRKTHFGRAICAMFPFTYVFSKYSYDPSYNGYDFYYFRFEAADYWFTRFLKKLKKTNPDSKVLIEFPNYPNSAWMVMPWCFPIMLKDIVARRKYEKYVDRFVVLDTSYPKIYGVQSLFYMNGIDLARVPTRKPCLTENNDRIDVIGVATMYPAHGYERFIESMNVYYTSGGDRNIVFHVVGEGPGPELKKYKELVEQYHLSKHVIFEGTLIGEQLSECYNRCGIALDDLCAYRIDLDVTSSLKTREYLAYGFPIISSCYIDVLIDKKYKYFLKIDNDDSPIDMQKIIDFYDEMYSSESESTIIENIRRFAEENCSYESTLKTVFSYLRS